MKFLICGLGSIGQRHYRNLLAIGEKDIIVFRTGKGSSDFVEKFTTEHQPRIFTDLNGALAEKPDVAIIANPTVSHIPVAAEAAKAGCHLFIEKPLSDSLDGVDELEREVARQNRMAYVAYNLRFHPLLWRIKEWLGRYSERFGMAVSFHAEMAERVTGWHPWENYRDSYACRKDLGGGVVLTQSHEIDYLHWLFGQPTDVAAFGGALGGLTADVEDVAKVLMRFKSGLVGSLDIDYLKDPPKRSLEIVTTKGLISWDYFGKKVEFIPLDRSKKPLIEMEPEGFERNQTFLDELREFVWLIGGRSGAISNHLSEGKKVLQTLLAIKNSLGKNQITPLQ